MHLIILFIIMRFLDSNRLLLECELEPIQGSRFQPTGFPSLGPAEFSFVSQDGETTKALLVESAQSMANRLENVCVDKTTSILVEALTGIPIITVNDENGNFLTNSIIEAQRMTSSYMLEGNDILLNKIKKDLGIDGREGSIDMRRFAEFVFRYDTNSVLHGLFLSKSELAGGRYKMTRSLSAFIEATGIQSAVSGGVKLDHLDPSGGDGGAKEGYGHIPYSKTEYSAESIKAYFNIDLDLIKSYGLGESANDLLFTFALWKIQAFLNTGLRLRTACDLKIKKPLMATHPSSFDVPDLARLNKDLRTSIKECVDGNHLTDKPIILKYTRKKVKKTD